MSRNIFEGMKSSETEDKGKREYMPPKEELINSELVNILLQYYLKDGEDIVPHLWDRNDSENEVKKLELMIESVGCKFPIQLVIDSLTAKLGDEPDGRKIYSKTMYLSAVIQALYNLDYASEFFIDVRTWPESRYRHFGWFLKGREDKPLILNLYGVFGYCGDFAEYCNFSVHDWVSGGGFAAKYCDLTFYDEVGDCGDYAQNSNFTLHKNVNECADYAENCNFIFHDKVKKCGDRRERLCNFNLMPGAEIEEYNARPSRGNVLRKMNEESEWEIIPPESLRR